MPYKDRIFYSTHKYAFSLPPGANADTYDYEWDWDNSFGNVGLPKEKLTVGEWSWVETKEKEVAWSRRFVDYLKKKDIRNTIYFTVAHTVDTGNVFFDDCLTIKYETVLLLHKLWDTDRRHLRS